MKRGDFQIGPGAASLLLIAVVLCMSVLGALSLTSAMGDERLSARGAALAQSSAQLDAEAERRFAVLDGMLAALQAGDEEEDYLAAVERVLPEGMTLDGWTVRWSEQTDGARVLDCEALLSPPGEFPRAVFTAHRLYTLETGDYGEFTF